MRKRIPDSTFMAKIANVSEVAIAVTISMAWSLGEGGIGRPPQ
jgi:hypothetical protein